MEALLRVSDSQRWLTDTGICLFIDAWSHKKLTKQWQSDNQYKVRYQSKYQNTHNIKSQIQLFMSSSWGPQLGYLTKMALWHVLNVQGWLTDTDVDVVVILLLELLKNIIVHCYSNECNNWKIEFCWDQRTQKANFKRWHFISVHNM